MPFIKKAGKKIFGAIFTKAEQKAIDLEVRRQLADYTKGHYKEIDAIILWYLHSELGYGPKRLKRAYSHFSDAIADLVSKYELDVTDDCWICTKKLLEYGIDLDIWEKEKCDDA